MNLNDLNRKSALALGIGGPFLHVGRVLLWGRQWPAPLAWPIAIDAFVGGGFLVAGALSARRSLSGKLLLAAAWGFGAGVLYRSFFEQVADPARHEGHEWVVMAIKALVLAAAVAGIDVSIRAARDQEERGHV